MSFLTTFPPFGRIFLHFPVTSTGPLSPDGRAVVHIIRDAFDAP